MTRRWIIAGVAAAALSLLTLIPLVRRPAPEAAAGEPEVELESEAALESAAACDAKAKRANLALTLKDMHGQDVNLAAFKGQVMVLNFWATWCGPCKYEIPALSDLYSRYKDQGLVVLGISVDDPESALKPFAEENKMTYPVLVGLGRDDVEKAYGPFWGIPVTVYVSRNGHVCKKHTGLGTKDQFEKDIKALL